MSVSSVMEQLRTRGQAMKVREVADLLNLDPTVVRYANEQKIPAFKVGSRWRFDPHVLVTWIEQLSMLGGEPDARTAQVGVPLMPRRRNNRRTNRQPFNFT